MRDQYKIYNVLAVLIVISLGNYLVFFSPETSGDEYVLLASAFLVIGTYLFFLKRMQQSLNKISDLSSRVKENPLFNENLLKKKDDKIAIETFLDRVVQEMNEATSFVRNIKEGNLTSEVPLKEGEGRSELMESLLQLRKHMVELDEEEKERKWVSEGMTLFVEILRQNSQSAEEFYDKIIKGIVKYLNANQGTLFQYAEREDKKVLQQVACYAYNRKKYLEKEVEIGQGLIGQVYMEKETIFLKEIPKDYIAITSGLGESTPRNLLLVPFKLNDKVECVIELASFHEFKNYQIEFLERVGENIASTISSYKINEKTKKLLEESQNQAGIMQAQEEELRQNMEELEATQEHLQRESQEKEKIQAEVIKTRDFLQKVLNAIPDPVFVKDSEHKITLTNDAFCTFNKVRKEEVIGKNEFDLYPKAEAEVYYQKDDKLFAEKTEFLEEEKVKIGEQEFFRISKKRIIEDEDGNLFLVGIHNDITHIKEIEQELAKEKYLMDALMKNATDYIYFKDKESRFIRMSDHMLQLFNATSLSEVVGKSDFDFFTEEHARPAFEAEQEIIRSDKPIMNLVERETWEDGRVTYVSTSKMPLRDQDGETIGTFGISRDVTDTKLMEIQMEKREKLLTSLLAFTNESIFLLDADFQFQFVSPAFASSFSLDPDDLIGKKISWFIHLDDEEGLRNSLEKLKTSKEKVLNFRFMGENGEYVKVKTLCKNALDDQVLQGFICSVEIQN